MTSGTVKSILYAVIRAIVYVAFGISLPTASNSEGGVNDVPSSIEP